MAKTERLDSDIAWIDLSFVERKRTPKWAIQVGIRYHHVDAQTAQSWLKAFAVYHNSRQN
jgi:hypothetical protein